MASKRAPGKVPSKIPPQTADRIVATALQNPDLGARRLVPLLKKRRIKVSATSVQNILRRNGLETRAKRLAKIKTKERKKKAPQKKARTPKSQPKKQPARIDDEVAERICEIALQNPELGAKRLVPLLKKQEIRASSSAVYRILKHHGLQTKQKRLTAAAEKVSVPVVFPKKFANRIPTGIEDRIVELSLQNPELGAARLVRLLKQEGIFVSTSSVYTILKRNNLENRQKRLLKLDEGQLSDTPLEPGIEIAEPLPGPPENEWPEPEDLPADYAPMPAEDELPEPVPEPEESEPLWAEDQILKTVTEPEPVPEAAAVAPPEPETSSEKKKFFIFTHKKSHWVFYPVYLLLLVLIGYLGFQAVQATQFANQDAAPVTAPVTAKVKVQAEPQASVRPLSDYQVIWQRNLFNITVAKDADQKNEISLEKIALAKKDIGLELVGTVVADDPYLRRAIIDNRKTRKQDAYREGDSAGKVKIKKILRNNVIITTAKGDELLTVEVKESPSRSASYSSAKSVGSQSSSAQSKTRSTASLARKRSIALNREDVEASLSDIDALMENVRLTPYMQGDQPSGFRISNIPADSVLRKMGLRSRDVIVGVDDETITSPDQASDFFQKLATGDEVTIKVKRRRRTRQITLNIE